MFGYAVTKNVVDLPDDSPGLPHAQRIAVARQTQIEFKRQLAERLASLKNRDDDNFSAPAPLARTDDDLPPPAGAAESKISVRKKKKSKA